MRWLCFAREESPDFQISKFAKNQKPPSHIFLLIRICHHYSADWGPAIAVLLLDCSASKISSKSPSVWAMFIWNAYFYVFLFACYDLIYSEQQYLPKVSPREGREALEALEGKCVTTSTAPITRRMTSASYIVCFGQSVLTVQYDAYTHRAGSIAALGVLVTNESRHDHQVYRPLPLQRPGHEPPAGAGQVIVDIECCPAGAHRQGELVSFPPRTPEEAQPPLLSDTFVHTVQELGLSTKITVCSDLICTASVDNKVRGPPRAFPRISNHTLLDLQTFPSTRRHI